MRTKEPQQIGRVIELLPSVQCKVQIGDQIIRCYLSGRMKLNRIKVMPGDRVSVVVSGAIGRIERRL